MKTYAAAIRDTLSYIMSRDDSVFLYGIGAPDHKAVFGTTAGLPEQYPGRVLDMPLSEAAGTGFGIGAAIMGMKPVQIHIRADFALLSMSQLINMAASHLCISGDPVPFTMRVIIGRGWGQGCHHSKSLIPLFAHVPGLRVLMPATPQHASVALNLALYNSLIPTVILEHRWLYWSEGEVDDPSKRTMDVDPVIRPGTDITLAATSWGVVESLRAADMLEKYHGVHAEVVSLFRLSPSPALQIAQSAAKTQRVVIVEDGWLPYGVGSEISSLLPDTIRSTLVGWRYCHIPTARHLEDRVYYNARNVFYSAERMLGLDHVDVSGEIDYSHENRFKGPF